MAIAYKAFDFKRIVFCILAMHFFLNFSISAYAYGEDSLFVVEGVKVDVTAENSVAAQDQAFAQAQIDAFKILAERLVDIGQLESLPTPDPSTISMLIKDYEVTDEQISSVRYIGTYTFHFRESDIQKLFMKSGVTYTTAQSDTVLVLPYFQYNSDIVLWSENNLWLQAWNRAQLPRALVPVMVPIGDLMDVTDLGDSQALNYDPHGMNQMLSRYGAKEAVLMIAVPEGGLQNVGKPDENAVGSLRIGIYRTDRIGPEHVKDLVIEADGHLVRDRLYDAGVKQAYNALQSDWKTKTGVSATNSSKFTLRVLIGDAKEWVRIQKDIRRIPGISNISVLSFKPSEVRISFLFQGDEALLRDTLARSNLVLGQGIMMSGGEEMIHDLQSSSTPYQGNFYTPPEQPTVKSVPGEIIPPSQQSEEFGVHTF